MLCGNCGGASSGGVFHRQTLEHGEDSSLLAVPPNPHQEAGSSNILCFLLKNEDDEREMRKCGRRGRISQDGKADTSLEVPAPGFFLVASSL